MASSYLGMGPWFLGVVWLRVHEQAHSDMTNVESHRCCHDSSANRELHKEKAGMLEHCKAEMRRSHAQPMLQTRDGKDFGIEPQILKRRQWLRMTVVWDSSALLRWQIVIARNFEDGDMVFSPVRLHLGHGFFVTLPREGLHLRARNPIAEAQRSLLNCWMVNGYKFKWNMAFCSRIIIDTAWVHLIFSVFSAFRVFTSQEKPRTEKLKNWIAQEKNGPQTSPMEFSFSVFQFSHCWCLKFNRNKIGAKIYKIHCKYQ